MEIYMTSFTFYANKIESSKGGCLKFKVTGSHGRILIKCAIKPIE
jgi:hypothetical protein